MKAGAFIVGALAAMVAAAAVAAIVVGVGLYDVRATVQHTQPVHAMLEATMRQSVRRQAAAITTPPLDHPEVIARGARCFASKCVQCHGGPGIAQAEIGRSMQPLPGPLVDAPQHWRPPELYWITRTGIKMSGMPAWQHRISEEDLWALVAFMQQLPHLDVPGFRQLVESRGPTCGPGSATLSPVPDARRGRDTLTQYACNACHRIPGVTGSDVHVGPPLDGLGNQGLIAGRLANTPENLVRWIRDPAAIDPLTTMPNLQVSEADAQDMAAYLAGLR